MTIEDQYSQIPCAAYQAKVEKVSTYAVYLWIEGLYVASYM